MRFENCCGGKVLNLWILEIILQSKKSIIPELRLCAWQKSSYLGQASEDQYRCTDFSWLLSFISLMPFSLVLSGPWLITHDFPYTKEDAEPKTSRTESCADQNQNVLQENLFWLLNEFQCSYPCTGLF